jgi:CHAP domain
MYQVKVLFAGVTIAGVMVLIMVIALCEAAQQQPQNPSEGSHHSYSSVAQAALYLQEHIWGSHSNQYDSRDPFMQPVLDYWAATCPGEGQDRVCPLAQSGSLQCVEFVTAAYFLSGDPLPAAPDAEAFWQTYADEPGWQQIPSPDSFSGAAKQSPSLGDLMVFRGGAHQEEGKTVEFGHIGIVVDFTAPEDGENGSIEIAQANGPGTKFAPRSRDPFVASEQAGNTYVMTVHPDYHIDTWGPYSRGGVAYSGLTVLGFLHHRLTLKAGG